MKQNFTIDEILNAVDDLQNNKKEIPKVKEIQTLKKKESDIPLNTLKLIEEAEKI